MDKEKIMEAMAHIDPALVEEAVDSLAQAKAMHDALEQLYNPHVDCRLPVPDSGGDRGGCRRRGRDAGDKAV